MGEKLVARFIVYIDGQKFQNAPDGDVIERPTQLEIEHRDQELSRLHLTVWDDPSDVRFPIFNSIPNPRTNPTIPVVAYIGWEDEELVKAFEGYLAAKKLRSKLSYTELVATHEAIKMKKRGKVQTFKSMTVGQSLIQLAAQEGIILRIDKSAAGDEALNTPFEVMFHAGETPFDLVLHYVRELGYVINTIKKNEIILRADKSSGNQIEIAFGGDMFRSIDLRYEQRQDRRASKRKGHGHEHKPGLAAHYQTGKNDSNARNVRRIPPALVKRQDQHRMPFKKFSVKNTARRLEREGDELTIEARLIPQMRNEERILLSNFGPEIDGEWQTASVLHRLGNSTAITQAACWRP